MLIRSKSGKIYNLDHIYSIEVVESETPDAAEGQPGKEYVILARLPHVEALRHRPLSQAPDHDMDTVMLTTAASLEEAHRILDRIMTNSDGVDFAPRQQRRDDERT